MVGVGNEMRRVVVKGVIMVREAVERLRDDGCNEKMG